MNAQQITSSVIVANALGYEPQGIPAHDQHTCCFCGLQIQPGDLCATFAVGAAFTDDAYLAARGSKKQCGYCAPLMTATGLIQSGYGVFSQDGVRPFRKWGDIREALLNPPEPPFVAVHATANNQHMAWRAPVNHSRDLFRVRVGLRDLSIRRQVIIDAIEHCKNASAESEVKTARKTLPNPFITLSSDLKEINHGKFTPRIRQTELTADQQFSLQFLKQLSLGESWALRFILTPTAGQ